MKLFSQSAPNLTGSMVILLFFFFFFGIELYNIFIKLIVIDHNCGHVWGHHTAILFPDPTLSGLGMRLVTRKCHHIRKHYCTPQPKCEPLWLIIYTVKMSQGDLIDVIWISFYSLLRFWGYKNIGTKRKVVHSNKAREIGQWSKQFHRACMSWISDINLSYT